MSVFLGSTLILSLTS